MTLEEKVREAIENMDYAEAVDIWNNYCQACNLPDDIIYSMSEFDEIMEDYTPWKIARACYYGDFCVVDGYFWFNSYGNLKSCDFPIYESPFSIDDVIAYIIENNDSLWNDEIQEILDHEDEDNEEDKEETE